MLMYFIPLFILVLAALPLIPVFRGKVNTHNAKQRVLFQVAVFAFVFVTVAAVQLIPAFAADDVSFSGSTAQGYGFLAAAIATSASSIGAGIAVAKAAPAAIGAISENPDNFGKGMIFVALAEGVAIYGLLISILILNRL